MMLLIIPWLLKRVANVSFKAWPADVRPPELTRTSILLLISVAVEMYVLRGTNYPESTFTFALTCQIFREKDGFFIYNVTTPHDYSHSMTSTIDFKGISQIFHPLEGVVPIICRGLHTSR